MRTAIDVADWIVCYRTNADSPVDAALLQKLLFFAQAFRLARSCEKLVEEPKEFHRSISACSSSLPASASAIDFRMRSALAGVLS
jgi:hypothetical protein